MDEQSSAGILLVDDRPENLLALEAILAPLQQRLVSALSGEEALRWLLRDEFAVILLDVQMTGLNGFETAEIIKSRERTRQTPIIFLTAISKEQEHVQRGYSVGGVDYISKPIQPDVLRTKVSVFVDLWSKNRQLQLQQKRLREAERRELELKHQAALWESEARLGEIVRRQTAELARASSALESLNRELNLRTDELERALNARNRFYASMSHELRTPINAILGYSSLLLEQLYGPLNSDQINGIERTRRAAQHLLELVNDVLDLSKIEAGKIELHLEPVAFPGLIEDLFVTVHPLAEEQGSELMLEHLSSPLTVISDPRRVRQILLNLLSNAIKFGRGNPVHVRSLPWAESGVEIQVSDQGVGIAEEDQEKIFDEFVQLARDRQDGTGLGLPISQRLATLLNGSLTVQSSVGVGSTFTLRLPGLVASRNESMPEPTPAGARAGLTVADLDRSSGIRVVAAAEPMPERQS
jgi:signal transduction histidine kinase